MVRLTAIHSAYLDTFPKPGYTSLQISPKRTEGQCRPMAPDLASLLDRPPQEAAPRLIGWTLISTAPGDRGPTGGIICETEAYLPTNDPAAHSRRGMTGANASLWKRAGTLYVHQMRQHALLDIVTQNETTPGAVLIRALKPTLGVAQMQARRGAKPLASLCCGPGNLTRALGITRAFDGLCLWDLDCPLALIPPIGTSRPRITASPRIGVSIDLSVPLRFRAAWGELAG